MTKSDRVREVLKEFATKIYENKGYSFYGIDQALTQINQIYNEGKGEVGIDREICICAAVRCKDGTIIRGHRHGDCFKATEKEISGFGAQGFITSKNRYVNRKEGAELQKKAGIISVWTGKPVKEILCSEDLY